MIRKLVYFSATILSAIAFGASAQNHQLSPNYGETRLSADFYPDPHTVSVQAGGSIEASNLGYSCTGTISDAPDYRIRFTGGGSRPLIISVDSAYDTTLIINDPDGQWFCDDDSGTSRAHNPSIRFNSPKSGQYDVWVGTFNPGEIREATLYISELDSQ
ncbi:peptidase S1 [Cyanobacterium stanieri LEGE 03274]|uniref:Peptidase S1 n=1 Tax=Cyanobacterium stanieri LEGE 03274 TaxID=1828756 RepID=A0ABR9V3P3_9CHRO|nr:peptidase S1 [Cyanobacterium stanieri]MBE9222520.1 peptidase S1 [Cyanobacterium stanieri LEGE 03274]